MRSLAERKHRRRLRLCLVEGIRLLEEALASGTPVDPIIYAPERLSATAAGRALRPRLERLSAAEEVTDDVLAGVSDTVNSQGVVAAARMPEARSLPPGGHVLVLDGIADPGNAGTMIRTAHAAGAAGVLATKGTTDLWSPKALRAGMGAHFHVPLLEDWSALDRRPVLLATARGGTPYWEVDWSRPAAIVIGSEAHGPSVSGTPVTIPMAEGAESLNAAAAAAVLLFASRRQG